MRQRIDLRAAEQVLDLHVAHLGQASAFELQFIDVRHQANAQTVRLQELQNLGPAR